MMPAGSYSTLSVELHDRTLLVTLDRQERLNAINDVLASELLDAVTTAAKAHGARAVVITGAGRAFCAGADIDQASSVDGVSSALPFLAHIRRMFYGISESPLPLIAAVHGVALGGGCEIALACDFRIATEDARIGLPELKIGALPGGGGMARIPALIGAARAKELILIAEPIDAATAERYGLLTKVVASGEHVTAALELAETLAERPPGVFALAKRAIDRGAATDAAAAAEIEYLATAAVFGTGERAEGMAAFLEKRPPRFTQR